MKEIDKAKGFRKIADNIYTNSNKPTDQVRCIPEYRMAYDEYEKAITKLQAQRKRDRVRVIQIMDSWKNGGMSLKRLLKEVDEIYKEGE